MRFNPQQQVYINRMVEDRLLRERERHREQVDQLQHQIGELQRRLGNLEFIEKLIMFGGRNVFGWRTWFGL